MKMRAVSLALIGWAFGLCLLGYLSSVQGGLLWWKDKQVDFKGLDKFLAGISKDFVDPEADLEVLKVALGQLTGGVKRAAVILLELSEVDINNNNNNNKCDELLLKVLGWAKLGKLTVVPPKGDQSKLGRSNKLVLAQLQTAVDACTGYIDHTFNATLEKMKASDAEWTISERMIDRMAPEPMATSQLDIDKKSLPTSCQLAKHLAELTRNHPQKTKIFWDKKLFRSTFEEYLREPCRPIAINFKELVHGAGAIVDLRRGQQGIFGEPRLGYFRRVALTSEACQDIVEMDQDKLFRVYYCRDQIQSQM